MTTTKDRRPPKSPDRTGLSLPAPSTPPAPTGRGTPIPPPSLAGTDCSPVSPASDASDASDASVAPESAGCGDTLTGGCLNLDLDQLLALEDLHGVGPLQSVMPRHPASMVPRDRQSCDPLQTCEPPPALADKESTSPLADLDRDDLGWLARYVSSPSGSDGGDNPSDGGNHPSDGGDNPSDGGDNVSDGGDTASTADLHARAANCCHAPVWDDFAASMAPKSFRARLSERTGIDSPPQSALAEPETDADADADADAGDADGTASDGGSCAAEAAGPTPAPTASPLGLGLAAMLERTNLLALNSTAPAAPSHLRPPTPHGESYPFDEEASPPPGNEEASLTRGVQRDLTDETASLLTKQLSEFLLTKQMSELSARSAKSTRSARTSMSAGHAPRQAPREGPAPSTRRPHGQHRQHRQHRRGRHHRVTRAAPLARSLPPNGRTSNAIRLHVYDLFPQDAVAIMDLFSLGCTVPVGKIFTAVNDGLYALGSGAYHVGVEVNGVEFAYGANQVPGLSGIFTCEPMRNPQYRYRTTVDLGERETTAAIASATAEREGEKEVDADAPRPRFVDGHRVIQSMAREYPGTGYDLLRRNCCTFARDACLRLGVEEDEIPPWFLHLASAGADAKDALIRVQKASIPIRQMLVCSGDDYSRDDYARALAEAQAQAETKAQAERRSGQANAEESRGGVVGAVAEALGRGFCSIAV